MSSFVFFHDFLVKKEHGCSWRKKCSFWRFRKRVFKFVNENIRKYFNFDCVGHLNNLVQFFSEIWYFWTNILFFRNFEFLDKMFFRNFEFLDNNFFPKNGQKWPEKFVENKVNEFLKNQNSGQNRRIFIEILENLENPSLSDKNLNFSVYNKFDRVG